MNALPLSSRFSSRILRRHPPSSSSSPSAYILTGRGAVVRYCNTTTTTTTTTTKARTIATVAAQRQRIHHRDDRGLAVDGVGTRLVSPHRGFATTMMTTTAASEHRRRQQQHQRRHDRLASSSSSVPPATPSHPFVLSHPSDVDHHPSSSSSESEPGSTTPSPRRGRVVCITSGKGGVGKTTSAASFAAGLALRGRPTVVVDFDMGLRNLDIHLGVERRVVFDFVHVLNGECTLNQALIPDRNVRGLCMLAASQTRDKDALTIGGVEGVLAELAGRFEYVVLDSPAGIESGARHAMYFCDDAILV
jgi:Mrp family chromosome partitioning ATPase